MMEIIQSVQTRIHEIRGQRIMLDFDLASLYEVETKVLNQAVKRNIQRFPDDFMFRLTNQEWQIIQSEIIDVRMGSQIVTSKRGGTTYLPYAFTEQGVAMLSGVLKSDKAINMNIAIMRAFVAIRQITLRQTDLKEQLQEIKQRLGEHYTQLNSIYDAMENLLDEKAVHRKWDDRERIGFNK